MNVIETNIPASDLLWKRRPCCYFHFVGWTCLSLGLHVDFSIPNVELHLPFGFIRVGWERKIAYPDGTYVFQP